MAKKSPKSKSYNTPLAPWVAGAHKRLVSEAEQEAYGAEYNPYEGDRLAEFTPEEEAGFQARQDLFEGGDPYADWASQSLQYGSELPGQLQDVSSGYGAREFEFGEFDQAAADQYMSPYMANVVRQEQEAAREEFQRQNQVSDAERTASGASGGYREAMSNYYGGVAEAEALADIEGRGLQSAFENAQQMHQRARDNAYQSAQFGDDSAYRASQADMDADFRNQDRVMDTSRLARDYATTAMDFGSVDQARELERISAMEQAGATQRQMEQQKINLDIADYDAQEAYPWEQMNRLQGIVAGVPTDVSGTQTSVAPPSFLNSVLGAGLGAAGIADLIDS